MHHKTDIEQLVTLYDSQKLSTETVRNARELGGYVTADGRQIKHGLLIRTSALSGASSNDLDMLRHSYRVKLIIDLRGDHEISKAPDPKLTGVRWVNAQIIDFSAMQDMMRTARNQAAVEEFIADDPLSQIYAVAEFVKSGFYANLYRYYIESNFGQRGLTQFFRELLSAKDGAVLWRCQEGKDRTGITAALLLAALGADYDTILADYELSNLFYRKEASQMEKLLYAMGYPKDIVDMVVAVFTGVPPMFFERAWQYMASEWRSPIGYIQDALGIGQIDIERLKSRYLV